MEASTSAAPVAAPWTTRERGRGVPALRTWHLFAILLLATVVADWIYQAAMPDSVTERLVASIAIDEVQVEQQLLTMEWAQAWSALISPVILFLVIAFWALTFQLGYALLNQEVKFGQLFRIAAVAHLTVFAKMIVEMWFRLQLPAGLITPELYYQTAGKLSDFIDPASFPAALRPGLSMVSIFELAWYGVVIYGLVRVANRELRGAVGVAAGVFLTFNALQWAINAYLEKVFT